MSDIRIDRDAWGWVQGPTLMLHAAKARRNLKAMADKAARLGLRLRPHFKTHQSQVVGDWFRAAGVTGITVSSIEMAQYFAAHGWDDITIAFPVNVRAMAALNDLASRVSLGLLVSTPAAVEALEAGLRHPVRTWIEVDTGDGRSGLRWDDSGGIAALARRLHGHGMLPLAGMLGHAGHTYRSRGRAAVQAAHTAELGRLRQAFGAMTDATAPGLLLSTGDTPACSLCEDYEGASEIRPGNFIFYDLQQQQIGSCDFEQISVAMACPVVALYPDRGEAVIHGGGVHFAKDVLHDDTDGPLYGRVVLPRHDGWSPPVEGCILKGLSQEHGVLRLSSSLLTQLRVGDLVGILPVHSCMTADLMTRLTLADVGMELPPLRMMKAY